MKGVLDGSKNYLKNDATRRIKVPRYKPVALNTVLAHCLASAKIRSYLPDPLDTGEPMVDRTFAFTILNTLEPNYFPD